MMMTIIIIIVLILVFFSSVVIITLTEELGDKELAEWRKSMDRAPRGLEDCPMGF